MEFMRGVFGFKPKPKSSRLPKWDLNLLIEWFSSEEFWPPETCPWYRLLQNVLVLTLLSSGRSISEIAILSNKYNRCKNKDVGYLLWPEGFTSKSHKLGFFPENPFLRKMTHWVNSEKDLRNFPVYNWEIYRGRRWFEGPDDGNLWDRDYNGLVMAFKSLIWECQRRFLPFNGEVEVSPHQTKKWACSLIATYWPDAKSLGLNLIIGNKSFDILKNSYIRDLPK